ncbi:MULTISPECIES: hypothetical protein [Edwardsiella]|uniref:Uncharacterized protein n=2 Tax=Edwardsiella anguillarum TaxID=1821960 RepID=A0A076LIP6_9GAMM|nr:MULTISPECIES: hypothetical protein [Edwardsiella]AKM47453.1 hypothetical protein QY76_09010 [Edwardsiella sp. EA181011]GAJ66129.1 hypothetical protein MA13_contig00001-0252 [Edwardsiella piscicida]AIJ06762.1 Hypothetical protein ETEE_0282 [Edwardsiella anguillarum ET080813]AKR78236.1 hypothetical protein AAZ33_11870 [Edwardsiella sp. LADL05-105]KAB0593367.1 hypothetical protein F7P84_01195 [Edwardsiella anguillarum]
MNISSFTSDKKIAFFCKNQLLDLSITELIRSISTMSIEHIDIENIGDIESKIVNYIGIIYAVGNEDLSISLLNAIKSISEKSICKQLIITSLLDGVFSKFNMTSSIPLSSTLEEIKQAISLIFEMDEKIDNYTLEKKIKISEDNIAMLRMMANGTSVKEVSIICRKSKNAIYRCQNKIIHMIGIKNKQERSILLSNYNHLISALLAINKTTS